MAIEIERKFLVEGESWRSVAGDGESYVQGYLGLTDRASVRIRLETEAQIGWLGIKQRRVGRSRLEFEYRIPYDEAESLMDLATGQPVEKLRYRIPFEGHTWEVDEFSGANSGLVLAEIELSDEQERFLLPDWVGEEVTADKRYYNAALALQPWTSWGRQ